MVGGLFWVFISLTAVVVVGAREVAVIENTWTGNIDTLGSGTHIWPFDPKVVPFVTKVTHYSLERQIVEIGEPTNECTTADCFRVTAVAADSNSPGRPPVYLHGRGFAFINPDKVEVLYRRYGTDWKDRWVEPVWVSTLKSVQGQKPYDFVGNYRPDFETLVEERLQGELLDTDGVPIIFVSQLAIPNFEFTPETNQYLETVQQKEFERQQQQQQIEINRQRQLAEQIAAETSYNVEIKNAERDREAQIARAEGRKRDTELSAEAQAFATRQNADANAYAIREIAEAEADALTVKNEALSRNPEALLRYTQLLQWNGTVPQIVVGNADGNVPIFPFLNLEAR